MKNRLVIAMMLLAAVSALALSGCGGSGSKSFEIAGTEVVLDKTGRFLDVTYPYSDAFEFTNTGRQELVYDLTDGGNRLFRYDIKYGFMNFGNRQVLEDDIAAITEADGVSGLSREELTVGKKQCELYSFRQFSEEYGREIEYRVYYTVHTHISETGFYRLTFENADGTAELEKTILKSIKFN